MAPDAQAYLFDLGNVLVDIDFDKTFAVWAEAAGLSIEALRDHFTFGDAYRDYECGKMTAENFYRQHCDELDLNVSEKDFWSGWNALLGDPREGISTLLEQAALRKPLYLFSNTNAAHHASWQSKYAELLRPFKAQFLSFEIGCRKPEAEAFRLVAHKIGLPPERILFFDDMEENIEGARSVGMQAVHVRSTGDIRMALAIS